jgi:dienelactone hydrolase
MCFSGGFALAMATDPSVLAPVMSQPSFPLVTPWRKGNARAIDTAAGELDRIKARLVDEPELCVLAYRFSNDRLVPKERFSRLASELGDRFVGVTFDSSPGNPSGYPAAAHSVLTEQLVESAADDVTAFFRRRLLDA